MIKKYFKLNNNLADPKRGMENYDPCRKYDYIYKVMVHNMNYVTKRATVMGLWINLPGGLEVSWQSAVFV